MTPRRLAWSLASGIVIGINPSVGITTVLVIMLAWAFGLNQIASQIGAHAMTPLHLLLFIPFIELGVHLFRTRRLPLSREQIEHPSHHHWRLIRDIWQWEWHALIVGRRGRDYDATAFYVHSPRPGAADASPYNADAIAPRVEFTGIVL